MQSYITRIQSALKDLQAGKMILLVDDPAREDEADLIFPAENANPQWLNFLIRECSGIVCLVLDKAQVKKLGLPLMVSADENTSRNRTPFTVSIEAKSGVTTGVSAADRTKTILTAIDETATGEDLVKPGHIFPLQAAAGGVLERAGHTEGALDLMRLAGLKPAAILCEVMNPDGTMRRGQSLKRFADKHKLNVIAIKDLIDYRKCFENLIESETSAQLPLKDFGQFQMTVIKEKYAQLEHIVLRKNPLPTQSSVLLRIHSMCLTGDLFGSRRCDCSDQLSYSLARISEQNGLLIYLNQEGRGIGLFNKIQAYALQEAGMDTIEANRSLQLPVDARQYYLAANILRNMQINQVCVMTNNPVKIADLKKFGIASVEREGMPAFFNEHNKDYLDTKKNKLNHLFGTQWLEAKGL